MARTKGIGLSVTEVKFQVEQIQTMAQRDEEKAHCMEDDLFLEVLRAVAKGSKRSRELAIAALRSSEAKFTRHCS